MTRTQTKIGLLDHMGGGNLGDDATQDAVMHNIKSRWPHAVIIGFSLNPSDTQQRHGIPSYAIRTKTWDLGAGRRDSSQPREPTTFKQKVKAVARSHRLLFTLLRAMHTVALRLPKQFLKELRFLLQSFRVVRSLDLLVISGGGQLTEWFGPWQFPYTIFKWVLLAKLARVRCMFLNVGAGPLTRPLSKFFVRRALRFADYAAFRDEQSRTLV